MSLLSLTGCDMFRKIAGRPTSADIEQLKVELCEKEMRYRARLDSLEREKQILADSLAVIDSLKQLGGTILSTTAHGGLFTTKLESRYYIIVGAFMRRSNAERLYRTISSTDRYKALIVNFRNGFNAVALAPSNTLKEAFSNLKAIKKEKFCPEDVWVLINE